MACTAYLVNLDTAAVSSWLSVGFQRVWKFNGKMYGIAPDGIYLIDGDSAYQADIEIAPTSFNSKKQPINDNMKRLSYATINGAGAMTITPVFDRTLGTSQSTQFTTDQRIKFGRGNKGRFIELKISSTATDFKLESIGLFPEQLSRRV